MKRIAWIDYAKGLCIVLVVMLYAAGLVEGSTGSAGWLQHVVDFARPFRMPDFFLVSGLLLPFAIQADWRTYFDRKVLHFAYFYVLWLAILIAFEAPRMAAGSGWPGAGALFLKSLVHPYSMLWFIYLLPLFFVATRLLRSSSAVLVWLLAAVLQVAQLETGVKVLDKFAMYYVYFYTGYALAPMVFRLADAVCARPAHALGGLGLWALVDAWLVFGGYAALPGVGLALALLGAGAVVSVSALLSRTRIAGPLAYCGRNSIVIYLAFLIPLTVTEKLLRVTAWIEDPGSMALIGTAGGVAGALALHRIVKGTGLAFLFERPARFILPRTARRAPRTPYPESA